MACVFLKNLPKSNHDTCLGLGITGINQWRIDVKALSLQRYQNISHYAEVIVWSFICLTSGNVLLMFQDS